MPLRLTTQRTVNVVVLISLLLSPLSPLMSQAAAYFPDEGRTDSAALYQTTLNLNRPTDRDRLDRLGVEIIRAGDGQATVLADEDQLESLARLGFEPTATSAVSALTPLGQVTLPASASLDDDADGLTNTQEQWWCTDPLNPDSDGDGTKDGPEVTALKAWLGNERSSPPSTGKPFNSWPPTTTSSGYPTRQFTCPDDDYDSVPDLAERWELGLNMNRESTDRDKFDDGQELFGQTNCPGSGGFCGYGVLPRNEDWGTILAEMPAWVVEPGNHPLVAAFPVPEVDVAESSLHVETVTVVTTDHVTTEGTEKSYSTAKTEGVSTSLANTVTWNEWQEVSESFEQIVTSQNLQIGIQSTAKDKWIGGAKMVAGVAVAAGGCAAGTAAAGVTGGLGAAPGLLICAGAIGSGLDILADGFDRFTAEDEVQANNPVNVYNQTNVRLDNQVKVDVSLDTQDLANSIDGMKYA